jgi:acyl-CoA synthetase (AMP-forming)/AMP-acid ligase II
MTTKLLLRELSRYKLGTFADVVYRNALLYPDSEAFVCGPERRRYGQFNQRVNALVHGLHALGIRKGDVVGILSWNRIEYPEVFGAAMKGGYVLAHFNPRLNANELAYVINDSEARLVFLGPELVEIAAQIRERLSRLETYLTFGEAACGVAPCREMLEGSSVDEPESEVGEDDPLVIFYTSGTTGMPRGAIYTHRQKLENVVMKALDIGVESGDRHLVVLPMFHIGGDSHIWPFFLMGACNVIMPGSFDPSETLETIVEERITDVHIVPTQLVSLLSLGDVGQYDLHRLKRIWYAASPMPTEVLRQGLATYGPVFVQGYGQTESGPHATVMTRAEHDCWRGSVEDQRVLASCGRPCIGVHMRIVDETGCDVEAGTIGEIIIASKRIMSGFWRRPDETRERIRDGWLHTGDLGYYDEKGFVYIADRIEDRIKTGGESVYPREVEDVLYRHPAVREAAVIGIPDPYWVEAVCALVVLKEDAQATEEDIIAFCRGCIAHYKAPKRVEFVDSLPKNPQGKILKKEIRSRYQKPQATAPEG